MEFISYYCFFLVVSLYLSVLFVIIKHHRYLMMLCSNVVELQNINWKVKKKRITFMYLSAIRTDTYYVDFQLLISVKGIYKVFLIEEDATIYGRIENIVPCLVKFKGNIIESVIVLSDKEYPNEVINDLRLLYCRFVIGLIPVCLLWWLISEMIKYIATI